MSIRYGIEFIEYDSLNGPEFISVVFDENKPGRYFILAGANQLVIPRSKPNMLK